ncbi:MAG: hypothetical protein RLZZ502_1773 [Pseudomonadota bacterium]|jgi:tripartite-type tricarboxylate transporter receptor subunit TctC
MKTLLLSLLLIGQAYAAWPDKALKFVVPYSPGGGADTAARVVAQKLSEQLGQAIVIENKPGAGGTLGADAVAKAPADGYTLLFDASGFTVNGALRKLSYDPLKDFIPISLIVTAPQILAVPANSPYKNLGELIAYAKVNPGKLSFGSSGTATASHLVSEFLSIDNKIDMLHIPYKGGAPAIADVLAGNIGFYFGNASTTLPHVNGGRLRALAVSAKERMKALPNVPTASEALGREFEVLEWNGLWLPKGTPNEVVQRLAKEVQAVMADAKVRERFGQIGVNPMGNSPAEFARYVEAEIRRWEAVVKTRGIKPD